MSSSNILGKSLGQVAKEKSSTIEFVPSRQDKSIIASFRVNGSIVWMPRELRASKEVVLEKHREALAAMSILASNKEGEFFLGEDRSVKDAFAI